MTIKEFFYSKELLLFTAYTLISSLFQALLVSLILFFHFQLNHPFWLTQDWIFLHFWQLISCSKILSFLLIIKLLPFFYFEGVPFRITRFSSNIVSRVPFILALFIWGIIGQSIWPDLVWRQRTLDGQHFFSFAGTILFFLLDFTFIYFLQNYLIQRNKYRPFSFVFIFTLAFFVGSFYLLPEQKELLPWLIVHAPILLVLAQKERNGWWSQVIYIILVPALLAVFLGQDLVWGQGHSLLSFSKGLSWKVFITVSLLSLGYIFYNRGILRLKR